MQVFRVAGVALSALACAVDATAQPGADDARVKGAVLAWAESLHSFSGEYTLRDERFDGGGSPLVDFRVVFRMRGPDFYCETYPDNASDGTTEFSFASIGGKHSMRMQKAGNPVTGGSVDLPGAFAIPHAAFVLPLDLFGWMSGRPLRERIEDGLWGVFHEDGRILFCQRTKDASGDVDVWLDQDLDVVGLDWFLWFAPDEATMQELAGIDRLRVGRLASRFTFESWAGSGGVRFPIRAVRSDYVLDPAYITPLDAAHRNGEISLAQLMRASMDATALVEERRVTLVAEPSAIALNPALSDADFVMHFPEGSNVGGISDAAWSPGRWLRRWWAWLLGAGPAPRYIAVALFGLGIAVSGGILVLRRRRTA